MSAFDVTLRNLRLPDRPDLLDIGIADGRIAALASGLPAGAEDHDLEGRLATAGLIETHIHLDKSCILDRCQAGTTLDAAIAGVAAAKADFTVEDVAARAACTLRKAIGQGTTRVRTHVEVDPVIGMRGFEGVEQAARDHAWGVDVQICVFPQEGMLNWPGVEELMIEGLKRGADVVGGAPYTDSDPHGQIDRVFEIAREFDVDIDLHLDFSLDAESLDADYVARKTDQFGWGGRVALGHVSKLSALPRARFVDTADRLANAGVAVTVLPATDLFLMGREHDHNIPRGVAPVHKLIDAGVNCSISTNNVLNPFTPFGDVSLMRMANLYAHTAHLGTPKRLIECLDMVTLRSAQLMNLRDYGIAVGNPADIVVFDASEPAAAVAELAPPLLGFKAGRRSFTREPVRLHPPGAT